MTRGILILIYISILTSNVFADSFCGIILAENGLNLRTAPNLNSQIITKYTKGHVFKFTTDGFIDMYQTIKDGKEDLKGEWIKIDLENYNFQFETSVGYVFMTPKYTTLMCDCRAFRHNISKEDLYSSNYVGDYAEMKINSLNVILKISVYDGFIDSMYSEKSSYQKIDNDYQIIKDTIFLKLDDNSKKKIISYPLGKNGDEYYLEEFVFIGYLDYLNSYLLQVNLWESHEYFFVNKKTGKISTHFYGLPFVSPKNDFFITINEGGKEEQSTEVTLYRIKNNNIESILAYDFSKWVYDNEIFWISENEVLIAARSLNDEYNWVNSKCDNYIEEIKLRGKVRKQYVKFKLN